MLAFKYSENSKYRRYTLKNGAKIFFFAGVWGIPLLAIFESQLEFALVYVIFAFFIIVFFGSWDFWMDNIRNAVNGKKIVQGGGVKALFTRMDLYWWFEK